MKILNCGLKALSIILALSVVSAVCAYQGDILEFYEYKNDRGVPLRERVEPFRSYYGGEGSVRVVVVGAVRQPGVRYVAPGTSLHEVLKTAGLLSLKDDGVGSWLREVVVDRAGTKVRHIQGSV